MDTTRLDRVGKFIHWRITLFAESADGTTASPSVPAGTTASPSVPAETTIPSTTLIPKPSSGSGVGGHSSGFSVLAVVSIVMGVILVAIYYLHKKRYFRIQGNYDEFSELEQLASFEEGDFDGISLNDLNLPERELIFASKD
jgi:hypothetical protein